MRIRRVLTVSRFYRSLPLSTFLSLLGFLVQIFWRTAATQDTERAGEREGGLARLGVSLSLVDVDDVRRALVREALSYLYRPSFRKIYIPNPKRSNFAEGALVI